MRNAKLLKYTACVNAGERENIVQTNRREKPRLFINTIYRRVWVLYVKWISKGVLSLDIKVNIQNNYFIYIYAPILMLNTGYFLITEKIFTLSSLFWLSRLYTTIFIKKNIECKSLILKKNINLNPRKVIYPTNIFFILFPLIFVPKRRILMMAGQD